jgi:hypothetical protein
MVTASSEKSARIAVRPSALKKDVLFATFAVLPNVVSPNFYSTFSCFSLNRRIFFYVFDLPVSPIYNRKMIASCRYQHNCSKGGACPVEGPVRYSEFETFAKRPLLPNFCVRLKF